MCDYQVPKDWADVMYNYLVHGLSPGSFFTSILANDFMGAISRSHPSNDICSLKSLATWIFNHIPTGILHGSYAEVDKWLKLPSEEKRKFLESVGLVFDEKTEIVLALEGKWPAEPIWCDI